MSKRLFVANWKMQLSFKQAQVFAQEHHDELLQLAQQDTIILCPSFPALHTLATMFEGTEVCIGAQNVSRHSSGPYTGEVSAQSLAEAGCYACIIGHSERRQYAHETNIDIEHKLKELLKQHLIPIVCIGETKEQHDQEITYQIIESQLMSILKVINECNHEVSSYIIAYEPVWAIGTGTTPSTKVLTKIFAWIQEQCTQNTNVPFQLLYGGSINPHNAQSILHIKHIDGLLIGSASLDFNTFKAVVDQH